MLGFHARIERTAAALDAVGLARVAANSKRYHSAASLGQRFPCTGAPVTNARVEVYFDQRRAWFPEKVLGPPR